MMWVSLLAGFLACGGSEPSPQTPPADVKPAAPSPVTTPVVAAQSEAVSVQVVPASGGEGQAVKLVWTGIGELHKGFFTTEDILAQLSRDLQGTVKGAPQVHIRFDSRWHTGWIQLQLGADSLRLSTDGSDGLIRLQALAPITTALARFRSAVAGRFDMRVDSFHVGIDAQHGLVRCVFEVAGTPPPDGRELSHCVSVGGTKHCGTHEGEGLRFEAGVAATIRECLR